MLEYTWGGEGGGGSVVKHQSLCLHMDTSVSCFNNALLSKQFYLFAH